MKDFNPLKGGCPVCNGVRKDCRQSNETGLVFCRESSANPIGFIFRGPDKFGFGMWQPCEDAEAFAQKSQQERHRQQQQWHIQNEWRRQQRIAAQLPALERHRYYSKILDQLPLREADRLDLERRGFNSQQIEADGYRSVEQWQEVLGAFPSNLPGLLVNGKLNSFAGCIFPIRDIDGLIVALGTRLRDGSNGRYRWLSSAVKKNPEGATPHLDGELPLGAFEPDDFRGDAIWLTEGVAIKPSITRYRLGVPVLGASSGLFSGSPNTCRVSLEKLSTKFQTQNLVIAVDAGDVKNGNVCQRWKGEFEFLRSLGYSLWVAWWGQLGKSCSDIDELQPEQLDQILRLRVSEFEAICQEHGGLPKEEFRRQIQRGVQNQFEQQQLEAKSWVKNHEQNNSASTKKTLELCSEPSYKDGQWQKPQEESLSISSQNLTSSQSSKMLSTASETIQLSTDTTSKALETQITARSESPNPKLNFNCFKEDNPEFEEKIRQVQRQLRSLSYPSDILLNQRYLPDDLPNQLPKSGLIGLVSHKGSGKSYLLKKIIQLSKKSGETILSITPRIALGREQAIKWEITWIDDYGVMQTRAEDTARQIEEVAQKRSEAKGKLAELEEIYHYQPNLLDEGEKENLEQQKDDLRIEIEQYGEQIENINTASVKTLALCWDSLWRTKDRDLKEALIVIDEAELGFKHFISGSTCKRNRPYLLKVFKDKLVECLMSGGRVILSDADLTDLPVNYVRQISPIPLKPFIVRNQYIGQETRWVVELRTGSRGNTLTDTIDAIRDGAYLAITTDSQAEAQALEKRILQEFPNEFCTFLDAEGEITQEAQAREKALIVRVDRTTTEAEAGKKFIQKPNEQILDWKPRILIYTPSMGVGVSIDETTQRWDEEWQEMVPYFDAVYGLFFGVIEPSQCRQQLSRVRANVPRIVYCKESNKALEGCSSFFPEEVKRQTLKYNHSALNILDIAKAIAGYEADDEQIRAAMLQLLTDAWDEDSRCWREPNIDLASAFKARENYGLWNLVNLLREELQDEGHTVVSLEGVKTDLVAQMADIKDELKMEEATLIAQAPTMPVEEARKVLNKLGATKDEHRSAQKTLLQEELPEVNLTPEFVKKAVVDDRRRWLNQQRLFWYHSNTEAVKQIDTDHWLNHLKKFAEGTPFMRDIRSHAPKVDALRKSGIFEFVDLENCDRIYQRDTPESEAFLKQCLRHRDELQTTLNILVTKKSSSIGLANRILGKVGLKLEKLTRSNKDTRWRLSADLVNDPDRTNVLKAFDLRWQISQEEAEQKLAEKQAQTLSYQGTETGGQSPGYINPNMDCPPSFEQISQGFNEVSEGVTTEGLSTVERLHQSLSYCQKPLDLTLVIEGFQATPEQVEAVIALEESQPRRQQLQRWVAELAQPEAAISSLDESAIALQDSQLQHQQLRQWYEAGVGENQVIAVQLPQSDVGESQAIAGQLPAAEPEPRVGSCVWAWIAAFRRWGRGFVKSVVPGVCWDVALDDGQVLSHVRVYRRDNLQLAEGVLSSV